jgi:protein involved in polysaccharide export with SLBB domain
MVRINLNSLIPFLLLIITSSISLPSFAEETSSTEGKTTIIEVGNKLFLNMPNEADFADVFEVDKKGQINVPEIGKVTVAGKTIQRVENEIKLQLSGVYKGLEQFYVEIRARDLLVTVLGYVNEPSQVSIPEDGNIQMVISQAGGLKPGAQLNKLQIRRGDESISFDYKAYLDSGDPDKLPALKSGDIVFVPVSPLLGNVQIDFDAQTLSASGDAEGNEKAVTLFGELHSPGSFSYKEYMNFIDALMRS